jgi:hypothetical protein
MRKKKVNRKKEKELAVQVRSGCFKSEKRGDGKTYITLGKTS